MTGVAIACLGEVALRLIRLLLIRLECWPHRIDSILASTSSKEPKQKNDEENGHSDGDAL